MQRSFEDLVAEAAAAPMEGWDFSWLAGRATEERPPWAYQRLLGERLAQVSAALDVRKVLWMVPGFTVEGYRNQLRERCTS